MRAGTALLTSGDTDAGLAAAKFLAAAGYAVHTIATKRLALGVRSRHAQSNHVISEGNGADFEAQLVALIEELQPEVFMPLGSAAALVTSKYRDRLRESAGINAPPLEAFLAAYDKDKCLSDCRSLGIPCPAEYSLEEATEQYQRSPSAVMVVKPARDIGSARGVTYVRTQDELEAAVSACNTEFDTALIQEYVPGGVEAMKTVVVMYSPDSTLLAAFTMQKVRQWPEDGGRTAVSVSTANERLLKQVLPFFEKWHWCGPAEVELKTDAVTGEDKVIEINPRLPGYLRFLCESGLTAPALLAGAVGSAGLAPRPFPSYRVGAEYYNPQLVLQCARASLSASGVMSEAFRTRLAELARSLPSAGRILADPVPLLGKALAAFAPHDAPLSW